MLKRGGVLIVLVILISVSVTGAYAINITLGGTVDITQILNMMNNKITNVGSPTVNTDAATKGYVDSIALSGTPGIIDADTLDGIDSTGFSQGSHTVDTDTTFDGTDFAVSNQACSVGQKVTGVDASGSVICAVDIDTTFDGTDFAVSNQACSVGQKVTGVDASGNVICAVDIDTDTVPWNSRVPQSTSLTTVDSPEFVGRYTSITIGTDGLPVISYRDFTNFDLKVAHCGSASCSGGSPTTTTVDSTGSVGEYTSITIGTDGLPVISYSDFTNTNLIVAKCTNVSCSDTPTITTVDSGGLVGEYTSITIGTDGFPVISYYDSTPNFDLKVAHCTNTSCSGTPTITTVDSGGNVGQHTSITIGTDGLPVISYFDATNSALKVAHCTNTSCSGTPTITAVDSGGLVGFYTSITIGTDGLPVISYYDNTSLNLKVAHCTNADCSTSDTTAVDSGGNVGSYTSITIGTDGFPVISYRDVTNSALKVAHCTNTSCSTSDTTTVDSAGSVGQHTSITIGTDGLPVISYYDTTNTALKVAHCTNPICLNNWIRR